MIVSHTHGFAFVHIHKTAGESITKALVPRLGRSDLVIEDGPRSELRKRINATHRDASHLRKHSPARDIAAYLGPNWDELTTFAVVRDPIARVRSLYRYLQTVRDLRAASPLRRIWYRTPIGAPRDPAKWRAMRALDETASLSEFIRHPLAQDDPAMRPQFDMVSDESGMRLVERILRLETLATDFTQLVTDIPSLPAISLPHSNASASATKHDDLDDADRALLAERFAADYEAFGYPFP